MLNELQKQKALEKLGDVGYERLPMFNTEQIKKEIAFNNHIWACKLIDTFNLPYRVLYNYFTKYGYRYLNNAIDAHRNGICLLNRCYPMPGYVMRDLVGISRNADYIAMEVGKFADDPTSDTFDMRIYITNKDINAEVEQTAARQHTWDLETEEGLRRWEYQFAHFLKDIEGYTYFDYFGTKGTNSTESTLKYQKRTIDTDSEKSILQYLKRTKDTNSEESTLKNLKRIAYWQQLSESYNKNPDAYRQEEPPYLSEYNGVYTLWKFYWNDAV